MADPTSRPAAERRPGVALSLTAALFGVAGTLHFVKPEFYRPIVPPGLPSPATLVAVSGLAEIAGAVGLLVPALRRPAGWGLIALLVAVFPANVYMAVDAARFRDVAPAWALWARLPLQGLLIWWVARASGLPGRSRQRPPSA